MNATRTLTKYSLAVLILSIAAVSTFAGTPADESPSSNVTTFAVQKPRFGQTPYSDVLSAAAQSNQCTALLTTNQLAAMMLAVTWPEDTGNDTTLTPSPMTLGRADTSSRLYYQSSTNGPNRRAFWHTGVGAWQLDDSGVGSYSADGKFNTAAASTIVAEEISRRYCARKTKDYAWLPWKACTRKPGICQEIYNSLLTPPDTLNGITSDSTTTRLGGAEQRQCMRPDAAGPLPCLYINPASAQGYKNIWIIGPNGTPPLTWPFYVYSETAGGTTSEWRHWLSIDGNSTAPTNIAARRPYGTHAADGLQWSATPLCDVTAQRGACTAVTVRTAGSASGTVTSKPTSLNCGSTCTATFATGTAVTLTANPSSGSTVTWSGCDSASGATCTVNATSNRTVTASFGVAASQTLSVSRVGTGSGTVTSNVGGLNCGAICSASYSRGTSVTLMAYAASGSTFSGWTGCDSASGTTCTLAMNSNRNVSASFSAAPSAPPRERLTNGSFTSGSSAWTLSGDFWSGTNLTNYRSASGYAAGGVDSTGIPKNNAVGSMYQSFAVPAHATTAALSLWINVTSEDTSSSASDFMNVTLQDASGAYVTSVCSFSNLNRRTDPRDYNSQCRLNLLPWAGRTLRVNFLATSNSTLKTTFRIDDVSVIADGN
ncbi:MAG: hypothetical protein JWO97_3869 [Acidobacteria bacterium]|nr:hypothetical protein [Acidobacteriota bacterium]